MRNAGNGTKDALSLSLSKAARRSSIVSKETDRGLIDVDVHHEGGGSLRIDVEDPAFDRLLPRRRPAAAGIDGIAETAADDEGVGLVGEAEDIVHVELQMHAGIRRRPRHQVD